MVVQVCVEVRFDFKVRCFKRVSSAHIVEVICFCTILEHSGKHRMELTRLDFSMVADVEEHLHLIVQQVVRIP